MSDLVTFNVSAASVAPPAAVYDVIADLHTHLEWAGRRGAKSSFKLLTIDAPAGPAPVGTTFRSTGANGRDSFSDESVVTVADAAYRFGFETDARLNRRRAGTWEAHFVHLYEFEPVDGGTEIRYTCRLTAANYVPYWLRPLLRGVSRASVSKLMAGHLDNLARFCEEVSASR